MTQKFQQISIIGLGLIGGSIARECKRLRLGKKIVAYNRSPSRRSFAKKKAWVNQTFSDPVQAVKGADLVILATPVHQIPALAKKIAPHLQEGCLVTDVGSTKEIIVKKLEKIFSSKSTFVGGHPIAGREKTGVESAPAGLFKDRWWIFTPARQKPAQKKAFTRLKKWVVAMGAKVAVMSPREHDEILALISHLPHMAAYALMNTALAQKGGKDLRYAAGGFKDFTRIAGSSPQMWAEICLDNSKPLIKMLKKYIGSLKKIEGTIQKGDLKGLRQLFEQSAKLRNQL